MPLLDRIGRSLESVSARVVDLFTSSRLRTRSRLSDEELETLLEMSEEEGALYEGEAEIIQEIIKLGDKTAKDCMTPRVDSFMLPDDLTNDQAIARLKENRYRRVPVYADTPEDRKSTRLNSSHTVISYAVFCLKKKKNGQALQRCGDTTT